MSDDHKALVEMLNAAGHDERLSVYGMLYLNAAAAIESLSERLERAEAALAELEAWREHGKIHGFTAGIFFEDGPTHIFQHDESLKPAGDKENT